VGTRSFYRVAKEYPPADAEYLTPQAQGRKLRPDLPEEIKRSWDALSVWDSEDGARRVGRRFPKAGKLIVRYDIPEGSGLRWEQTIEPGHFDLRGDPEELKRYLASDFLAEV
jgi:hypothetical protein